MESIFYVTSKTPIFSFSLDDHTLMFETIEWCSKYGVATNDKHLLKNFFISFRCKESMNCMDAMKGNVAVEHHKCGRTDPDLQKKFINLI